MNTAAAWHLRVFDFSMGRPEVHFVRPTAVIAVRSETGIYKASCAESLGRSVCRDFDLDVGKVLWVEQFDPGLDELQVAVFKAHARYGSDLVYKIDWRPIQANELASIKPFL